MLLLAAYPENLTGKAVREIWFEYFLEKAVRKNGLWIFESGRIFGGKVEIFVNTW